MSVSYEVQVCQVGSFGLVPGAEIFWMSRFDDWMPLVALMGIIRGGGKTIVVNTGPALDFLPYMNKIWREEFDERVQFTVTEEQKTANALASIGVKPEEVDYVIVTPLQAYAIGNVDLFPNAKICLSKTGWIDFHAPKHFDPRRRMAIPDRLLTYLQLDAWNDGRVRLLENEDTLLPGLHTWFAGTHHRSSMGINVTTDQGTVVLTDTAFYYGNIENDHPIGIMESLEECKDSYARIRKESDIVVPLYDPAVLQVHPDGYITKSK